MDQKVLEAFYDIVSENKKELYERIAADRTRHLTVVVENAHQDHNASAILRSCECLGIQDVHIIEKDHEYTPQREIARGAGNWVDMYQYGEGESPTKACFEHLKKKGYQLCVTSPHASKSIREIDLKKPIALVFGTEWTGVSQEAIDCADELLRIPMYGFTESFNLSVSVAISMSYLRTKLEESDLHWKLSEEEQVRLKIAWCKSILTNGEKIEERIRERFG